MGAFLGGNSGARRVLSRLLISSIGAGRGARVWVGQEKWDSIARNKVALPQGAETTPDPACAGCPESSWNEARCGGDWSPMGGGGMELPF